MEIDVSLLFGMLATKVANFFAHSFLFSFLKFFLFVYSAVLLADVVLLLILRGVSSDIKQILYGTSSRPLVSKNAIPKRWEGILARLDSENPSQYKVAILEADALAEEILSSMGYKGGNMTEKLDSVWGGQLETKDLLTEAHDIRNKVVHEEDFTLSQEDALRWLQNYRKFFEELELF